MPSPIEQLQSAGFSDDEIGQWSKEQRTQLGAAGFGEKEIDDYLGVGQKSIPKAFIDRVTRSAGSINDLFSSISEAGAKAYRDADAAPVISPENERWLRDAGIFNDPAKGQASPIRMLNEAVARPIAAGAQVLGGVFGAGVAEVGAAVGGIAKRLGAERPEAAEREAMNLANYLGAQAMARGGGATMTRPEISPTGVAHDVQIGGLPEVSDFADATRAVAGTRAPVAELRAKIQSLWDDHGIHPSEVAHDAETDPTIAQSLASATLELPRAYVPPEAQPKEGRAGEPIESFVTAEPASIPGPELRSFSPSELRVDPQRFQFKEGAGPNGVSERLQGVEEWDPIKAGTGIVWEDKEGTPWIADGHQRLELAQRIAEADPAQNPRLNAFVLREADGVTDADARAVAASKNIAEGTGTPVDAAKVLRDRPDLASKLPPRSELVRQAQGLMALDPEAFGKVVNGVVPANHAAIVGRLVPNDPPLQNALVDLLAKTSPDNAVQAESIVRQGIDAGMHTETQATLFGDQDVVSSLYGERARILDASLRQLRRDRSVFQSITDNRTIIEELGNQLAQDENLRRATTDGHAVQVLQTLANRRGGIGESLTAAARSVADGSADRAAATRAFVAEIRRQAASGDLTRLANGGGGGTLATEGAQPAGATATPGEASAGAARAAVEQNPRDVSAAEEARAEIKVSQAITPAVQAVSGTLGQDLPLHHQMPHELIAGAERRLWTDVEGNPVFGKGSPFGDRPEATDAEFEDLGPPKQSAPPPTTERTAQGDQLVIPGAERSAVQAAAGREAEGHGRIAPPAPQQEPGGMFAPKEAEQPSLLTRLLKEESGSVPAGGVITPERTPAEQAILDHISVGERTDKRPWTWSRLYSDVTDRLFPVAQSAARAVGEGIREALSGVPSIPTADNPYQLMRLLSGAPGKADHWLNFSTFDFNTYENNGLSLKAVLDPVKSDLNGFRAFIASVRALELEKRGIETGMNLSAAREVAATGLDRYVEPLTNLIAYQDRLTQYLRDSGVLSAKGYEAMRAANELYVPFHRVFAEGDFPGAGGQTLQPRNPIQRIKGSEREIIDPIESIIRNTYLYTAMAERNAASVKLVDLLREGGDAHGAIGDISTTHPRDAVSSPATAFADVPVTDVDGAVLPPQKPDLFPDRGPIEREAAAPATPRSAVPEEAVREAIRDALNAQGLSDELFDFMASAVPPAENEIAIFRDGKREVWQVDRELAGAVKALDRQSIGAIESLLSKPASWLRAGAVLTPDFQLRHTFRDYLYGAITSRGFFSPADMARGFAGLIAKDADFQNWLKSGGGNISRVAIDRRYMQESLGQLNGETGLLVRAWNVIADPDALYTSKAKEIGALPFRAADKFILNPLRMATEFAENASHLGAFKKAMAEGTDADKAAIQAAGWTSRDLAVDAARRGAATGAYNMVTAFANITIQDTDRVARAFIKDPVGTSIKIGAGIVLPSALLYWANHDDPDYWELPQWERDLFWVIPVGSSDPSPLHIQQAQERGEQPTRSVKFFMRLPKPWGMGIIFGSGTERTLQALQNERPDAFKEFAKSIADTVVPQFYPTATAPLLDQFANRSAFTNRTLVPSQLEKQLPEYQYTPYTTETSKKIGQLIAAFPGVRQESLNMESPVAGGVARALTTPILIENYLRGWTGGLGMYTLQAADAGLRAAGVLPDPPRPADTLADIPVVKAFIARYPTASAESIEHFYQDYDRNKRFFDTWKAKAQEGDEAAVEHIMQAGGLRMFVQLDATHQMLGEQSQLVRDIWKAPDIPPDEKRQLIDQIYYSQIQIAAAGRQQMRAIDAALQGQAAPTLH